MTVSTVMNGKSDSSKTSEDDNGSHDVHLYHDIIIYSILTRIPLKDLYRFRCVCKLWHDLIHDPSFINMYSQYTTGQRGFISLERDYHIVPVDDQRKQTIYNLVFFDLDTKEEKLIPFHLPSEIACLGNSITTIEIAHSLNGMLLICFHVNGDRDAYFAYNLLTASWLYMGRAHESSIAFLVYDPITSKYKVVAYSNRKFLMLSDMKSSYMSMPPHLEISPHCRPVSVDNCLHLICRWRSFSCLDTLIEENRNLIRLDTSKNKVSTINLPVKALCYSKYCGLLEMGGLLWFYQSNADNNGVQLWYLKKKKNGDRDSQDGEWAVMCNINLMREIGLHQLKTSPSISVKSRSSAIKLKHKHWNNCPVFNMEPNFEIVFPYFHDGDKHMYICSYDIELDEWKFIYAREINPDFINTSIYYWHANTTAQGLGSMVLKKERHT